MIDIFVNHLPRFFDWVLKTTSMASILVGLILGVKTLLRTKLTPRWHYLLWMILIVRLLLPWSPDSSFSIYSILSFGYKTTISLQPQSADYLINERIPETTVISSKKAVMEKEHYVVNSQQITKESNKITTNKENISNEKPKGTPISFYTIALYIWLIGVFVLSFTTYFVNRRLCSVIKKQPVITDKRITDIFETCMESMSVQKGIPLILAGKISSPTVLGFFHPKVLLSMELINRLTEPQLRHIFYHELAHIKRRDVGLNWLMYCLLILNWFNPILWFAYYCMREDQELACDAFALTFMEEEEKISYGLTIISLLEHYSNYYQAPSLANLSTNKRTLKRRIFMIKKFQKKSYRWSALGIFAVIAVSSLTLLNAHADESNGKQKEQTTTEKVATLENKSNETVYTPPKQKENFKDMTKEEILTKMLNTVDNFETAKGEFKVKYDDTIGESLIQYELSLNNKAGEHSKTTYITPGAEKITNHYYKDGTIWEIDENSRSYGEGKYLQGKQEARPKTLTIENAFSVDSEGINVTKYRERPLIGQAMSSLFSLFPYEIASNYTRDLNTWEIEKQNEELLGHNTLVIKGKKIARNFQSFRFWVDKDTGILVKYETYNSDGKVVNYLHPTKLEINVPIDSKDFKPNLTGYKKMAEKGEPRIITGNVDESIPEELKMQWEAAKKKPNETTILHQDDKWYILAEKGYVVDGIEPNGKEGTLYLAKVPPQKSQFNYRAVAEGYKVDSLKTVYR